MVHGTKRWPALIGSSLIVVCDSRLSLLMLNLSGFCFCFSLCSRNNFSHLSCPSARWLPYRPPLGHWEHQWFLRPCSLTQVCGSLSLGLVQSTWHGWWVPPSTWVPWAEGAVAGAGWVTCWGVVPTGCPGAGIWAVKAAFDFFIFNHTVPVLVLMLSQWSWTQTNRASGVLMPTQWKSFRFCTQLWNWVFIVDMETLQRLSINNCSAWSEPEHCGWGNARHCTRWTCTWQHLPLQSCEDSWPRVHCWCCEPDSASWTWCVQPWWQTQKEQKLPILSDSHRLRECVVALLCQHS